MHLSLLVRLATPNISVVIVNISLQQQIKHLAVMSMFVAAKSISSFLELNVVCNGVGNTVWYLSTARHTQNNLFCFQMVLFQEKRGGGIYPSAIFATSRDPTTQPDPTVVKKSRSTHA